MSDQLISKDKTYRTRDGREAVIVKTDHEDAAFPVIAAVRNTNGTYVLCYYTKTGKARIAPYMYGEDDPRDLIDLIEVKPRIKRTLWLNLYEDSAHGRHNKEAAMHSAMPDIQARKKIEIEYELGEGL